MMSFSEILVARQRHQSLKLSALPCAIQTSLPVLHLVIPSSFVRWMILTACFLLDAPDGHILVLLSVVPSFLDPFLREDFSHNGPLLHHSAALDL